MDWELSSKQSGRINAPFSNAIPPRAPEAGQIPSANTKIVYKYLSSIGRANHRLLIILLLHNPSCIFLPNPKAKTSFTNTPMLRMEIKLVKAAESENNNA